MESKRFVLCACIAFLLSTYSYVRASTSPSETSDHNTDAAITTKKLLEAVGQPIFLNAERLEAMNIGCEDFIKDLDKSPYDRKNQYILKQAPGLRYYTSDDHDFKLISAFEFPHPIYGKSIFLKLRRKDNGEEFFYRFEPGKKNKSIPFILSTTIESRKKAYLGTRFLLRRNPEHPKGKFFDINTGKKIKGNLNEVWTCANILVDAQKSLPALLLVNMQNRSIAVSSNLVDDPKYILKAVDMEKMVSQYGPENWKRIAKGNVRSGMTREMVRFSLGNPNRIKTIHIYDQWVYEENERYLYFRDGYLFRIR